MANYAKINIGSEGRVELHNKLALTGAEISVNRLPAGAGVPFVHAHKNNEEIYGVLEGKGKAVLDGEEIALTAGDWLRVAPATKRRFSASANEGITFVCIQVRENSLEGFTAADAIMCGCRSQNNLESKRDCRGTMDVPTAAPFIVYEKHGNPLPFRIAKAFRRSHIF